MNREAFTQGVGRVLQPGEILPLVAMWGCILGIGFAISPWIAGQAGAGMTALIVLIDVVLGAGLFALAHKHIPTPSRGRQVAVGVVVMLLLSPLGTVGRILMTVLVLAWIVVQARLNRTGESII